MEVNWGLVEGINLVFYNDESKMMFFERVLVEIKEFIK